MVQLDTFDLVVLTAVFAGTIAYLTKGLLWAKPPPAFRPLAAKATRSIVEKMNESDKDVVVFYGSQTGTAEDYASRLAKEGLSRYGLRMMVADLEDYDLEDLDTLPEDKVAIFVMATYGEGEPTDNAAQFFDFVTGDEPEFSQGGEGKPLENLKFVAFGLGNNTYEHYNAIIKNLNDALLKLGAKRIAEVGLGDDGAGTMEEDYLSWKEEMWAELASVLNLSEREAVYVPALMVTEVDEDDEAVYHGEFNRQQLEGTAHAPYLASNPFVAPISHTKELFSADAGRNCLHVEIDLDGSNLKYTTGDHIAVWPQNSTAEVERFLRVLGVLEKRDTALKVESLDPTTKVPFPSPTTYDAVARYYLEINGVVSRQFLTALAQFAPNEAAKAELVKLGGDREIFAESVTSKLLNIGQLMEAIGKGEPWAQVPFSFIVESINHIQPRYYSISSSSYVDKTKAHITVAVESVESADKANVLKGVASNYLLALKQTKGAEAVSAQYNVDGPRGKYAGIKVPVHIRHSNFKLPTDPTKPIIMVGPGTGVAPFRGFLMERAAQHAAGVPVGKSVLFFGCRRQAEDYIYQDEWVELKKSMGDKLEIFTAFSRDGAEKEYVQHLMLKNAKLVNELLKAGAYFYVCGDASRMAKEVSAMLGKIIHLEREIPVEKGEELVKVMRTQNLYQEDVWS
ncbi:uncharacterized protein V1510DRAFT_123899 [Dipodascopsis tothii]|uniref:uncharacterized protein n=1 Tax=Dipodascopsis tothii TaxID=44089 RepID=UPI0034CDB33E